MRSIHARRLALLALILTAILPAPGRAEDKSPFDRWEKDIARFEKQARDSPPPKHAILFAGSSSIRLWNLAKSFPGQKVINRGFGGSQIADSTHFAPRILLGSEPRLIVLYAGENDLAAGKTPEQVAEDFRHFVKRVHDRLPKTKIVYISIKPSLARAKMRDKQKKANELIEAICKKNDRLAFLDVTKAMLGDDGKPRKELFVKDGLHMNEAGYKIWAAKLEPYMK
jgi:lysophospholipase L1-like esterase